MCSFIWETWERTILIRFTPRNDLKEKYSAIKAMEVLKYVDDLELEIRQSNFGILKLKFLFRTRCDSMNNLYGKLHELTKNALKKIGEKPLRGGGGGGASTPPRTGFSSGIFSYKPLL